MFLARPLLAAAGLAGVLAAVGFGSSDANAQQIYRIVEPGGRITFTDKAPLDPNAKTATAVPLAVPASGQGVELSALPFELRQAAARYPVTLYTGPGCGPCVTGRTFLSGRGIPFAERTVTTNEDIEALKRLAGAPSLPFLTIGGQQLKGFSETEWAQFLDAAGYPKTSQLPTSYTPAPAAPLVVAEELKPRPPARVAAEPARAAAPPPPPPAPANPAGISF